MMHTNMVNASQLLAVVPGNTLLRLYCTFVTWLLLIGSPAHDPYQISHS